MVDLKNAVEWRGECRETLYIFDFEQKTGPDHIPITAVTIDDQGEILHSLTFTKAEETALNTPYAMPETYLYEPAPALQKSNGFGMIAKQYSLKKLHKHTHLYTSDTLKTNFPGRCFKIIGTLPVNRKALTFPQANLTIRNFPSTVETLKKQLRLKDGGPEYLSACTLKNEEKTLIHCQKPAT